MNNDVSAVIVTRGNVDLDPCTESLKEVFDEVVVWDNSVAHEDLKVYGRYAAIDRCRNEFIYVQDDDAILPAESLQEMLRSGFTPRDEPEAIFEDTLNPALLANMPDRFRIHYPDSALVGFGAIFRRDLPFRAFQRFADAGGDLGTDVFHRCCDVVFSALTRRYLVDVPYTDREFASGPDRMWRQPDHYGERQDVLRRVRAACG